MQTLFCPIRKEWVASLPEEIVRQGVITHMVEERGFPAPLICVEKAIRQLPHISSMDTSRIPDRRADIICFCNGVNGSGLHPLLLVECKAVKLTTKVIGQVVGYNHFVQASFIAIVNAQEMRLGWYDQARGEYLFLNHLPSYQDLLTQASG